MKKLFILFVTIFFIVHADAQFSAGVKAGVNFSKEKYKSGTYTTSSHTYFVGGAFGNFAFGKSLALQLELNHSSEGTAEEYMANNNKVTGVVTIKRINVPLLFQYKTKAGVFVETGPQVGFLLSAKGKYTNGDFDFKPNTQSTMFSWVIGAGYNVAALPGLGIDARYAPGLSRIDKGSTNAQSIKGSSVSLTVKYAFVRGSKKK